MRTLKTSDPRKLAFLLTEVPELHFRTEPNPRRPGRLDFLIDVDDVVLQTAARFDLDPLVPLRSFLDRLDTVRDLCLMSKRAGGAK